MSTTLRDIADRIGVSTATVSRALNDRPGVSEAVRRQVLELARELKFTPNVAARSLATASTRTVAFITHRQTQPLSGDPFYSRIMLGAEEELARHDYHLIVSTPDDAQLSDQSTYSLIRERRVDGYILAGPDLPSRFILHLRSSCAPLVLVDNCLAQTPMNCILNEDEEGGYLVTRHLLEHSHKQVVCLSGPDAWISSHCRAHGYRRALVEAGLEPLVVHTSDTTLESGYVALEEALGQCPELTAVFAINDAMAIGAMRALRAAGRRVPGDVAIVGCDDVSHAVLSEPPLTTYRINKRKMGTLAARRLWDLMQERDPAPVRCYVGGQLVVRQSCGCFGEVEEVKGGDVQIEA